MKIKFGVYSFFILLLMLASCISSKKVPYFQSETDRQGKIVDIPSDRLRNTIRFRPGDILGITVNVPGEPLVAADYNLPLIPAANNENNTEEVVSLGVGRQTFLIREDGSIDYPVIGKTKFAGLTLEEAEQHLKDRLSEVIIAPITVTVRLMNFKIYVTGEVGRPGAIMVESTKGNINILEALALAGDMSIYGKRDDITLLRPTPDGGYTRISLDISREDIISSPYYFLHQNDVLYVQPVKARTQSADISPMLSVVMGVTTFTLSLITFVLMLTK